ncbi:MAG: hypothetical protein AAF401_15030, partial [Pseudomonadota bacterium]
MFGVKLVARRVGPGHAGEDVTGEAGDRLAAIPQKGVDTLDLLGGVIANLGVPDELKLGASSSTSSPVSCYSRRRSCGRTRR